MYDLLSLLFQIAHVIVPPGVQHDDVWYQTTAELMTLINTIYLPINAIDCQLYARQYGINTLFGGIKKPYHSVRPSRDIGCQ